MASISAGSKELVDTTEYILAYQEIQVVLTPMGTRNRHNFITKPTTGRGQGAQSSFYYFITRQMVHISQMLVKFVHLVSVSENSAPWPKCWATQTIEGSCDTHPLYVGPLGVSILWLILPGSERSLVGC